MSNTVDLLFQKELQMDKMRRAEFGNGKVLAPLNIASWSLFTMNDDTNTFIDPLRPFDCIVVNQMLEEYSEDKNSNHMCEMMDMVINLNDMTAKSLEHPKQTLVI